MWFKRTTCLLSFTLLFSKSLLFFWADNRDVIRFLYSNLFENLDENMMDKEYFLFYLCDFLLIFYGATVVFLKNKAIQLLLLLTNRF